MLEKEQGETTMEKLTLKSLFEHDNGATRYLVYLGGGRDKLIRLNKDFKAQFKENIIRDSSPDYLDYEVEMFSVGHDPYGICLSVIIRK